MAQKQVVSNVRNQNFQLTANSVCFALLYLLIKKQIYIYSLYFSLKHTKHILYTHALYFQKYNNISIYLFYLTIEYAYTSNYFNWPSLLQFCLINFFF